MRMAGTLELRVVTPEKPIFEGTVDFVAVPAHDGELGILPRHARFLATLGVGELRARSSTGDVRLFVEAGFVQVTGEGVTVLCEHASKLAELDLAAIDAEAAAATAPADRLRLQQRAAAVRRIRDTKTH